MRRKHVARVAAGFVLIALAIGLYNDLAIRWRVEDSLAGRLPSHAGLRVDGCRRMTTEAWQSKNFFRCTVRPARGAPLVYWLEIHGRCWLAARGSGEAGAPPAVRGCLSPFAPSSLGRA